MASKGGKDGGGMLVTEFGDALIKNYRELERDFATLAARRLRAILPTKIRAFQGWRQDVGAREA